MAHSFAFLLLGVLLQQSVPFKPSDEYSFRLDYQFRNKAGIDRFEVDWSNTQKYSEGTLPYLIVHIKLLKLSAEEERVKIVNNRNERIYSRKASLDDEIEIEMGFTDDLKDRTAPYDFNVFLTSKKLNVSRINLFVDEDGTFYINGEKRGKF